MVEEPNRRPLRVGLTGGIASGKSAVAELLAARGAVVIDSDRLARDAVAVGTEALAAIVRRFSVAVLAHDGSLDRSALGRIVFGDPDARRDLEAIVHPEVRRLAAERERSAADAAVVVQMIPLLVETGQQDAFDHVIVVDVEPSVQRARLVARDGSALAAEKIAAQAPRARRLAAADTVIDNSGDRAALAEQVASWWSAHGRDRPGRGGESGVVGHD